VKRVAGSQRCFGGEAGCIGPLQCSRDVAVEVLCSDRSEGFGRIDEGAAGTKVAFFENQPLELDRNCKNVGHSEISSILSELLAVAGVSVE
jgi:hypothetical protein